MILKFCVTQWGREEIIRWAAWQSQKDVPHAQAIHEEEAARPGMNLSHEKLRDAIAAEHQSGRGAVLFGPLNQPWQ